MTDTQWVGLVLGFWFGLNPGQWFGHDPTLDRRISEDFLELWAQKRQFAVSSFLAGPLTALAGVILFDQFPRNMFRNSAAQFATDMLALAIARGAVDDEFDHHLAPGQRAFLYLPFQHSEAIADQNLSLSLFTELGEPRPLEFAKRHYAIIARYGRFPHRNSLLGRKSRADEIAAGRVVPW